MTYAELKKITAGKDMPISGTSDDGEPIAITEGYDEEAKMHFYDVRTYQHNDWIRINIFWEDGTVEEMFDK